MSYREHISYQNRLLMGATGRILEAAGATYCAFHVLHWWGLVPLLFIAAISLAPGAYSIEKLGPMPKVAS
jgi:hypothetical protein